jgi:ketol-acid reductoisomerase
MSNYFNTLTKAQKLEQLAKCDFLEISEFTNGLEVLKGKKVVIIGCGSQGLNQGLNMRDSGLDISYALREAAIKHNFFTFQDLKSICEFRYFEEVTLS